MNAFFLLLVLLAIGFMPASARERAKNTATSSTEAKIFVGYQGWFRCPGDGSPKNAWSHWSNGVPSAQTLTVDLYPDVRELSGASLCALPGMTIGGKQAYVFSSYARATVEKHFEWMQHYGIDGVLLQRFTNAIPALQQEGDVVLKNVMASAHDHQRVFAIEYDVSGCDPATVLERLKSDWGYLSQTLNVTSSPEYFRMKGKPLVSIWGLGLTGHHIGDPDLALQIIHWFKDTAHVMVMGGTPAYWGTLNQDSVSDKRWAKVYAQMDVVQPWTVGRYSTLAQVDAWKQTHLIPDLALTRKHHQMYMPVIFPGFSWHNLNRDKPENQIPRLGGKFFWKQAYNVRTAGATILKIAMFDEVNEGTAILKAASERDDAPQQGYWLTLDADGERLPSDWYLQLAGKISQMFHGSLAPAADVPIKP